MARSDRRVEIDELASEIANQLQSYTAEIRDEVKKAVDKVAKETVSTLKQTSPKDTGDYARNWTFSVNPDEDAFCLPEAEHLPEYLQLS